MFESATGLLRIFGGKVREEMQLQNLTMKELVRECELANGELQEIYPEGKYKSEIFKWEDKIKEITRASHYKPKAGGIKRVVPEEIMVICRALKRPPEYMLNAPWNNSPIHLDPLFDDGRALFIGHLLKRAEEKAKVLTGWAEFLPCSLETHRFMQEHHRALHRENEREEKRAYELAEKYDQIGGFRRARFLDRNRPYDLEHLIFFSDLLKIADGIQEYKKISSKLRHECLTNLSKLVADETLRLKVFIGLDEDCRDLKKEIRGNDSILVFGTKFTLWRVYDGSLYWSESDVWITKWNKWVDDFKSKAKSETDEVRIILSDLCKRIKTNSK